ncbi:MAG TPA: hypothetical protein VNV42_11110 [Solirubrobacteraceae bacterium]|nr:hypothetical protein [Solirubrobacteraceae bacterium]
MIAPIEVIGLVREIEAFFNDWERHAGAGRGRASQRQVPPRRATPL